MKESVFVDTGYWIALFDRRDQYHMLTKELLPRLLGSYRVVLSDRGLRLREESWYVPYIAQTDRTTR